MTAAAAEIKACCAAAYASPVASWLLGTRFHPGGAALTERLIRYLAVGPGDSVADIACGLGESSLQVARTTGAQVIGVDLSSDSIAAARLAAEDAGLAGSVEFLVADAEALPVKDGAVAGVLCECSLCTFPDKERAMVEIARILKPGGRLALSDMIADPDRLPATLRTLEAWVACLADARPLAGIVVLARELDLGLLDSLLYVVGLATVGYVSFGAVLASIVWAAAAAQMATIAFERYAPYARGVEPPPPGVIRHSVRAAADALPLSRRG